jgi:peptidoglycan/LPS O-acetylase OafA/YrhL
MTASVGVTPSAARHYRADVDGLRAVSILLVVAFHAGIERFGGGYVGVDVFFVLSGFLITGLLVDEYARNGRISLREFYARRARRLLPLAGLVLVTTFVVGQWLLPPLARISLVHDVRAAALYVANWRFAGQATAYSDAEVTQSLLLHYWSLSVEEQFYVLWPLLIVFSAWVARRRGSGAFVPVVAVLLGVVVATSLTASVALTPQLGPGAYYATHTRLWEMGIGAGLALALPRVGRIPRTVAEPLAVLGLFAIVGTATAYGATTSFPGVAATVPVLGTALLLISGSGEGTTLARWLGIRPLVTLGRWSYAWYLWHWPVIGAALLVNDRFDAPWPRTSVVAVAVLLSLGLAAGSHRLVENPLRFAPALRAPNRSLALGGALTMAPVIVATAYLAVGDIGARNVVPEQAAASASVDPAPVDPAPASDPATFVSDAPDVPMSPLEAAEDNMRLGEGACHVGQDDPDASLDCVLGDPDSETTVALLGDSHALHWVPALDAVAHQRGWRLLVATKSSCAPFDARLWNSRYERRYTECEAWRGSVLSQLRAREDLAAVILARSRNYSRLLVNAEGVRLPEEQADPVWRGAAARTFAELGATAPDIVVLRDTPWAPVDVPTCLSDTGVDASSCAFPLAGHAGTDTALFEAERAVAPAEVVFLDPTPLVCPTDPCEMVTRGGTIKYRDAHHLTHTFSRQLGPELDALLPADLAALRGTRPHPSANVGDQ